MGRVALEHTFLPRYNSKRYGSIELLLELISTSPSTKSTSIHPLTMPLVVPGINSNDSSSTDSWMTKLMGKKLSDSTSDETSFAKKDLPQNHRVVDADGGMMTMDHNPDRLNVHVDKDGPVRKVTHG